MSYQKLNSTRTKTSQHSSDWCGIVQAGRIINLKYMTFISSTLQQNLRQLQEHHDMWDWILYNLISLITASEAYLLTPHATCRALIYFKKEKLAQGGGRHAERSRLLLQLTLGHQENVHQDRQHYRPNPAERRRGDKVTERCTERRKKQHNTISTNHRNIDWKGGLLHRCK